MRCLRTAVLPLLALSLLLSARALARTVTITITGTVASGTDVSGVFGKPGSQLSGKFTLIFTFDDSKGENQPPDCKGGPPYTPRICSSGSGQSSRGTATLQIGDSAPFEFGVSAESSSAATRTTWIWPQSSYRMTLGVGDGRTMVAGAIGSATPKPVPPMTANQPPPPSAAWDYPLSDSAVTSTPGISFTIDDRQSGAKAYGLLAGTTICVGDSCGAKPVRVYFSIAYVNPTKVPDNAFVRAATTWEHEVKSAYSFREGRDIFINRYVRTVEEFVDAWKDIEAWHDSQGAAKDQTYMVIEGGLFTHASFFGMETGLEFAPETLAGGPSTLSKGIIDSLPRLNWDKSLGRLRLFGCNTAEFRGIPYVNWSPANEFAKSQRVTTFGETGYSYFSQAKDHYVQIDAASQNVFLGAYRVGRNLVPGTPTGAKMPDVPFPP